MSFEYWNWNANIARAGLVRCRWMMARRWHRGCHTNTTVWAVMTMPPRDDIETVNISSSVLSLVEPRFIRQKKKNKNKQSPNSSVQVQVYLFQSKAKPPRNNTGPRPKIACEWFVNPPSIGYHLLPHIQNVLCLSNIYLHFYRQRKERREKYICKNRFIISYIDLMVVRIHIRWKRYGFEPWWCHYRFGQCASVINFRSTFFFFLVRFHSFVVSVSCLQCFAWMCERTRIRASQHVCVCVVCAPCNINIIRLRVYDACCK